MPRTINTAVKDKSNLARSHAKLRKFYEVYSPFVKGEQGGCVSFLYPVKTDKSAKGLIRPLVDNPLAPFNKGDFEFIRAASKWRGIHTDGYGQ